MQQDNDPKHPSHTIKEWLMQKEVNALKQPNQNPYCNPIEMLWNDPKWAVHAKKPTTSPS